MLNAIAVESNAVVKAASLVPSVEKFENGVFSLKTHQMLLCLHRF